MKKDVYQYMIRISPETSLEIRLLAVFVQNKPQTIMLDRFKGQKVPIFVQKSMLVNSKSGRSNHCNHRHFDFSKTD